MKRILKLSAFILVYLLCCAKSCDNEEQFSAARNQKRIKSEKDSLTSAFGSDTLSATNLNAFEETAKNRFNDFFDYLAVLSDTTSAPEFMAHSKQMILGLFRSGNDFLRFTHPGEKKMVKTSLNELAGEKSSTEINIGSVKPDSLWISQNLHPVSDSAFAGRIGFSYRSINSGPDLKKYHLAGGSIDFFAVKREKKFGKEVHKVWTVLLGENN
ncbi:MAG: hypothetical protein NTU98_14740 [Bacteroidetes bacterium]|nr:hypothetical protein [Bacteroidota bacterium]